MFKNVQNRKGFTLIELMIVVAIIGILAAIAIPAFVKYLKQTKTSEANLNLKSLGDGASAYYQVEHYDATGQILNRQFPGDAAGADVANVSFLGQVPPGTRLPVPAASVSSHPWKALKFAPTKPLYFDYKYFSTNAEGQQADNFTAFAEADLDGDTVTSQYRITSTTNAEGELQITPIHFAAPEVADLQLE